MYGRWSGSRFALAKVHLDFPRELLDTWQRVFPRKTPENASTCVKCRERETAVQHTGDYDNSAGALYSNNLQQSWLHTYHFTASVHSRMKLYANNECCC